MSRVQIWPYNCTWTKNPHLMLILNSSQQSKLWKIGINVVFMHYRGICGSYQADNTPPKSPLRLWQRLCQDVLWKREKARYQLRWVQSVPPCKLILFIYYFCYWDKHFGIHYLQYVMKRMKIKVYSKWVYSWIDYSILLRYLLLYSEKEDIFK